MKFPSLPQSCGLVFLFAAAPVAAQGVGHERFHLQYQVRQSHDLVSNDAVKLDFADLDQDGFPEMLYADPFFQAVGGQGFDAGRVILFDGKTGDPIFQMQGAGTGAMLGSTAHFLDDITGDGIPDISLTDSYQFAYHLHLLSGSDFSPLIDSSQYDRFYEVISLSDRTGDGIPELAAVRYSQSFGATVEILDGSDFSMLLRASTSDVSLNLVRLGDLDGDGLEEVGTYRPIAPYQEDRSQVLRGVNLRTMQRFAPEISAFSLLANAGDVDADGVNDVLASHAYWDHMGIENSGLTKLLSGATGNVLAMHYGQSNDFVGGFLNTLGDLDGDGHSEYLVGAKIPAQGGSYGHHSQEVRIFSGATYAPVDVLFGRNPHFAYGDRTIAVYPATANSTAFLGFSNPFRRNFFSTMTTNLYTFRYGN